MVPNIHGGHTTQTSATLMKLRRIQNTEIVANALKINHASFPVCLGPCSCGFRYWLNSILCFRFAGASRHQKLLRTLIIIVEIGCMIFTVYVWMWNAWIQCLVMISFEIHWAHIGWLDAVLCTWMLMHANKFVSVSNAPNDSLNDHPLWYVKQWYGLSLCM